MSNSSPKTFYWQKQVPNTELDAWLGTLSFLSDDRLVVLQGLPPHKTSRIEYYAETTAEIARLSRKFGGSKKSVDRKKWLSSQQRHFHLSIPPHFCVASDKKEVPASDRKLPSIIIPANMAFGTGEHATTAMCLRRLAEWHGKYPKGTMLDVGTGSGILALAGAVLGLKVTAIDLDPDCILESKANAARNASIPPVKWKLQPVEKFSATQRFDLIVGNLYSECIIGALPRLKRHLKEGGAIILSGILKKQNPDVLKKIRSVGLNPVRLTTRGKWVCVVAQ